MENKLDILTQKLYNEGVDKARKEAGNIINQAKMQIIGDNIQKARGRKDYCRCESESSTDECRCGDRGF